MTDELEPCLSSGPDCVHFDTVQQIEAEGYALASQGDTHEAIQDFKSVVPVLSAVPEPLQSFRRRLSRNTGRVRRCKKQTRFRLTGCHSSPSE
jgi:hypothetical protein